MVFGSLRSRRLGDVVTLGKRLNTQAVGVVTNVSTFPRQRLRLGTYLTVGVNPPENPTLEAGPRASSRVQVTQGGAAQSARCTRRIPTCSP
jgi:hypothetical protein